MSCTHPFGPFLVFELRTNLGMYPKGRVCRDERPVVKPVELLDKKKKRILCANKNSSVQPTCKNTHRKLQTKSAKISSDHSPFNRQTP